MQKSIFKVKKNLLCVNFFWFLCNFQINRPLLSVSVFRYTTFTILISNNYSKLSGISKQLFKSKYYEQTLLH